MQHRKRIEIAAKVARIIQNPVGSFQIPPAKHSSGFGITSNLLIWAPGEGCALAVGEALA
jgi:hypothetical protein